MDRNPTARFAKQGPRYERFLKREAEAIVERECETYVRSQMQPKLRAAVQQARAKFRSR